MASPPAGFFNGVYVSPGIFVNMTTNGTAYHTSVTATNILGTLVNPKRYPIQKTAGTIDGGLGSNSNLNVLGRTIHCRASGIIANTSTPNLTMEFRLGTNILATTGVQATAAITGTTVWVFESFSRVSTAGASGAIRTDGLFTYYTTAPVAVSWQVSNSTVGTALSIDLSASYAITCYATWGTSSSSNTLACHQFFAEILV